MTDIFNLKLGTKEQKGIIIDIVEEIAIDKDRNSLPKIVLIVDIPNQKRLRIDEAWVRDRKGQQTVHGLWINYDTSGNINRVSTLGKLMSFFKVNSVKELLQTEVSLHPKKNDFMAVIAMKDFNENNI